MEQTVFNIGGVEYKVIKKGIGQANQVASAGRWLAVYGSPAIKMIQDDPEYANMSGLEILGALLSTLNGEALVELFDIVFGCGIAVANEEFDIELMIDGLNSLYQNSPAIKRLVGRFFSKPTSNASAPDNSTQSE